MENISADDKDKIYHMSLQKTDSNFKGYGLAKISKKALLNNMKLFRSMPFELSDKENYYGLIRKNLVNDNYHIIKSDKYNLAEINTPEDLSVCSFKNETI